MEKKPSISYQGNGPYIVKDIDKVIDSDGKPLEKKQERKLCRCGGSNYKPFCDGSHIDLAFKGEYADLSNKRKFDRHKGKDIAIYFNKTICSDAGDCYKKLPAVFGNRENRIVEPDAASADEIIKAAASCPSGALFCTTDDQEAAAPELHPGIVIEKNGPYRIQGAVEIDAVEMDEPCFMQQRTLCRCGGSKIKPFCDGTHKENGFRDDHLLAIVRVEALKEELTRVTIGKKELVVVRQATGLSVFSGVCLHAEALMSEGFIEENYLTCGKHRWRYDLDSGKLDGDPSMGLKKLNITIENGWLLIERSELNELADLDDD